MGNSQDDDQAGSAERSSALLQARELLGQLAMASGVAMTSAQIDEIISKLIEHVGDTLAVRPAGGQEPR